MKHEWIHVISSRRQFKSKVLRRGKVVEHKSEISDWWYKLNTMLDVELLESHKRRDSFQIVPLNKSVFLKKINQRKITSNIGKVSFKYIKKWTQMLPAKTSSSNIGCRSAKRTRIASYREVLQENSLKSTATKKTTTKKEKRRKRNYCERKWSKRFM